MKKNDGDDDDQEMVRGEKNSCKSKHDCKAPRKKNVRHMFVNKMNAMKKGIAKKPPIESDDEMDNKEG